MPQPFPVPEDDNEQTQPNTLARNGFVGAFVRSVRRGQQTPAVGKVGIGVLVAVLAAGSVVGLSVLLRGTNSTAAAAATAPSGGASADPRSAAASTEAGKPATGSDKATGIDGTAAAGVPDVSGVAGAPGIGGAPGVAGTPGIAGALGNTGVTGVPGTTPGAVAGAVTHTSNTSPTAAGATTATSNRATAAAQNAAAAKPLPAVLRGPTRIVGSASNRCIDVTDGASGARLQIYDCSPVNTNTHQTWTFYADETVRTKVTGQCMTVAGSWASGTPISAKPCNGSALQKFVLNGSHDLTNYSASAGGAKCVDVTGKATGNGAKLQLWTCEGTSNQKWS
jgi:hypothetical protein